MHLDFNLWSMLCTLEHASTLRIQCETLHLVLADGTTNLIDLIVKWWSIVSSNLERENFKLVLKIFNTFVSSAIRIQGETLHLVLADGTKNFSDLTVKRWSIVNVKTPQKGCRLKDVWQQPVRNITSEQLQYLDKLLAGLMSRRTGACK